MAAQTFLTPVEGGRVSVDPLEISSHEEAPTGVGTFVRMKDGTVYLVVEGMDYVQHCIDEAARNRGIDELYG